MTTTTTEAFTEADGPPEPGMVWLSATHIATVPLSGRCHACGKNVLLTPPCVPGRWYSWLEVEIPLADRQLDGRGVE